MIFENRSQPILALAPMADPAELVSQFAGRES